MYVPPTISGDLVKNFAEKVARTLRFEFSNGIVKTRVTEAQKSLNQLLGRRKSEGCIYNSDER